ncbi:MAG: gamma-butyrobetaine dioxygenase [Phenylobacterium sp.]|nr:MAG: gamma-butyrobetaine dioxygenase [Phenylobacterium sp.]
MLDGGVALDVSLRGEPRRFHAIWLRDNAQDPATRDPGNGQRLITLLDIPAETRIAEAAWADGQLRVRFDPDGKVVAFDPDWLLARAYDEPPPPAAGWTGAEVTRWDPGLANRAPVEDYELVRTDPAARLRWLQAIRRFGFARLTGATAQSGLPLAAAELFGYVRETNYGRVFDVRAEVNPSNLAYTNLGLQAHTDNPYRDPAPGLQILACLANTVEGGESIVIDGFKVAERLQAERPEGFDLLTRYCARFEYAGAKGVRLRAKRPILELGADGELIAVRFNNRSAAAFSDIPYDRMAGYYAAYRRMAELVEDPALAVRFQLAPGDLFIVDNLRVLHARSAITSAGGRWLQGCYADKDGLLSTLAALEAEG